MTQDVLCHDIKSQMYNSYVSLAVIFPLIEAWITTSNSCLKRKKNQNNKEHLKALDEALVSLSLSLKSLYQTIAGRCF